MAKYLLLLGALALLPPAPVRADAPPIGRESIEWIDMWVAGADKTDLPHVLLIGDSITRAYHPIVEKALAGKAYVARYTASQFLSDPLLLENLRILLTRMKFDVIHFNNGMRGWTYGEDAYRAAFPAYLAVIRDNAPAAKLIWGTTTPTSEPNHPDQVGKLTERVKARNDIAREFLVPAGIPEDDLFTLVAPHPEYHDMGGIHFLPEGVKLEGEQVAAEIAKRLPPGK